MSNKIGAEITLALFGSFCVIGDMAPYFCKTLDEVLEIVRATVRFLIRVNTMDSVYSKEVKRTNRIGVGLTGVHEFAWKFWGFNFHDLIDENKSQDFWNFLLTMKKEVRLEALRYSKEIGVVCPHTDTTIKPSGSVSKLFGLTEGWHLPAMGWYMRWVQFSETDPLVEKYRKNGYPVRSLKSYKNSVIVGFPTVPLIATLLPSDKLVTAAQATPEQQYKWLMLGEKYWIKGLSDVDTGNQISYTLKYDPKLVDFETFKTMFLEYQSKVKCCSVMPAEDGGSYEYLPEEPVSHAEYLKIVAGIKESMSEDVDKVHVDCSTGACPINFTKE